MRLNVLLICISLLFSLVISQSAPTKGTITKPEPGTMIMPGTAFDFEYRTRADYGSSSLNFTVFILSSQPASFGPTDLFTTGHFFGRFAEPNYPGNPNPPNIPPEKLVMPDFSKSPGGWGVGQAMGNTTMYLVVLEEFADADAAVGARISIAMTPVVYNRTSS